VAERFDRDTGDLFALQNDITRQIAIALNTELVAAEARRPTEHPDALDYILRGRAASHRSATPANYTEAVHLFERALALDPGSVEAQTSLAGALIDRVNSGMTTARTADIARAKELIGQALARSPDNTGVHLVKGLVLRAEGRCDLAIPEYERVIASNRNSAGALFSLGVCKLRTGSIEEAMPRDADAPAQGKWIRPRIPLALTPTPGGIDHWCPARQRCGIVGKICGERGGFSRAYRRYRLIAL